MDEQTKVEIEALLKSEGLDLAEENVKVIAKVGIKILGIALPKVNPMIAGIVLPILQLIEPKLLELIDGIDGKVG